MGDENGNPTEQLFKKYQALAKGGVGGIITGFIGVSQQGKSSGYNMCMIDKTENVEAFKELTMRIHEMGIPIIAQLAHCGGQTKEEVTKMQLLHLLKFLTIKLMR